jgi:hypothetical protein
MYCLAMIGLGMMAFAVYSWVPVELLLRNGQRVTAEVIGIPGGFIDRDRNTRQERTDELIVRYRPPDEEPLELSVWTAFGGRFKPGQQLQIIYNPANPKAKAILPEENLTLGPKIFLIMGFLVTCLGLSMV